MSDWNETLAPTPDCIAIEQLGETLTPAQQTHVEGCVRCQTELALFRDVMKEESSPESQWIADELRRRNVKNNVVAFRPKRWNVLYAVAAALVLLVGVGSWLQMREPSIDVSAIPSNYRSARLDVIAPIGEVAQAPNELRWEAVPQASRYRVRILEVDANEVWSGDTTEARAGLPPAVVAQFAPGKSLRWEVQAFRGTEVLASSETQTVRVTP